MSLRNTRTLRFAETLRRRIHFSKTLLLDETMFETFWSI